jgi:hypothetical protein
VAAALSLGACGGDGGDDTQPGATDTGPAAADTEATTPEPTKVIKRADLQACLAAAGLKPQDTADVVVSTSDVVVRGIGVEFPSGTRVVLFVDKSAASAEGVVQVQKNAAPAGAEVTQSGNVALTYLSPPAADEQAKIDACLTG